jgi:APA family basic amino acid/polyamine antiporter
VNSSNSSEQPKLKRSLGLPMITFYGLGTIVGGGFYALTGKVAGESGMLVPVAFLAAAGMALLSAFSFAELSARYPVSAGEAHYVGEAFGRKWLAAMVGWMVIATGVVSAATLANAFTAFLTQFVEMPEWLVICGMVFTLGLISAWGINESTILALVVTVVEIAGLLLVLAVAGGSLADVPDRWRELTPSASVDDWSGIFLGAYIAFYSFVGFEDMVNVAEEVKQPQRNLPIAILVSVIVTGLLYFSVTLVTVLSATQQELIESNSPLSLALGDWQFGGDVIAVIGMLAGLNGALVQVVMASRVAYGLAGRGQAPSLFARVNRVTRTPLEATAVVTALVLFLALWLPLESLAMATSTILLLVYAMVNMALWRIKGRIPNSPEDAPCYPRWLPLIAALVCAAFLMFQLGAWLLA